MVGAAANSGPPPVDPQAHAQLSSSIPSAGTLGSHGLLHRHNSYSGTSTERPSYVEPAHFYDETQPVSGYVEVITTGAGSGGNDSIVGTESSKDITGL